MRPTDPRELKGKKQRTRREAGHARGRGRIKAVVLAPVLGSKKSARGAKSRSTSERSPQARLDEAVGLAAAIDLDIKASGLVPVPNPRLRRERVILQGETPNPINLPTGCRFHTRCPVAIDRCADIDPPFVEVNAAHTAACLLVK